MFCFTNRLDREYMRTSQVCGDTFKTEANHDYFIINIPRNFPIYVKFRVLVLAKVV